MSLSNDMNVPDNSELYDGGCQHLYKRGSLNSFDLNDESELNIYRPLERGLNTPQQVRSLSGKQNLILISSDADRCTSTH